MLVELNGSSFNFLLVEAGWCGVGTWAVGRVFLAFDKIIHSLYRKFFSDFL